ncbi:hypothetical protein LIER_10714 [Lithospermum erythrorhizon]|uniref:MHD1 domain-containing protein n=1 Tax=Lithospermum erythrorhizon TaxID=34254 RepID=A0AAV3PPC7_LITER
MECSSSFSSLHLVERYREDRRKLLEYLLSSSQISSVSDLNLDALSTDYIIQTIQSGGVIDVSEATKRYTDEAARPVMMNLHSRDIYFLHSDTESPGSPPRRVPPPVMARHNGENQFQNNVAGPRASVSAVNFDVKDASMRSDALDFENDFNSLSLGLPMLRTGLSDDDLVESAFEVLLVCMVSSGVEIQSTESRKKEKSSKLLDVLKNKKDKRHLSSQSFGRRQDFSDTFRVQLQISESKGAVFRRLVVRSSSVQGWEHADLPHISLGFLNGGYRSDFPNEKLFLQWKNRHVNILEELLSSAGSMVKENKSTDILLSKIRSSEEGEVKMSYSERNEVLSALKRFMSKFSSIPARFGIQGETYYWTSGYPLNVRIYEKLLLSVFDTLEDGQLVEEADDLLNTIKLTWPVLGIIHKLHDALYAWVLFKQFVVTQEAELLHCAIVEVQRVLQPGESNENGKEYLGNLFCLTVFNGSERQLTVVQSIFLSMGQWCDKKLQDYHLHFDQKASLFKKVIKMASTLGSSNFDKHGKMELRESDISSNTFSRKVKVYVLQSLEAACNRVSEKVSLRSDMGRKHPLALLANELKSVVDEELSTYYPVLCYWYPEAGEVIAMKLHHFYGEMLTKNNYCQHEEDPQDQVD